MMRAHSAGLDVVIGVDRCGILRFPWVIKQGEELTETIHLNQSLGTRSGTALWRSCSQYRSRAGVHPGRLRACPTGRISKQSNPFE